eukprot:889629-Rhodomonas_salina.2
MSQPRDQRIFLTPREQHGVILVHQVVRNLHHCSSFPSFPLQLNTRSGTLSLLACPQTDAELSYRCLELESCCLDLGPQSHCLGAQLEIRAQCPKLVNFRMPIHGL